MAAGSHGKLAVAVQAGQQTGSGALRLLTVTLSCRLTGTTYVDVEGQLSHTQSVIIKSATPPLRSGQSLLAGTVNRSQLKPSSGDCYLRHQSCGQQGSVVNTTGPKASDAESSGVEGGRVEPASAEGI